ncbi:MAG: S-layer homology domain-containing protein, partial [Schwartzia sp.]|nr:S-layer homology domain-containing protein [Schwartzia sp. (in: firmicutes)]
MKKSLVSALTTALVVGAASTTFAAANPFEDVPADHWAYDAIAQLAADGVIEGYGDGTYRGDQEITRYEMAQMIARAMAKGANGADKALVDKLAAEFADELNNLGVRVAALEKKVDNVKWTGMVRYRYITRHEEHSSDRND